MTVGNAATERPSVAYNTYLLCFLAVIVEGFDLQVAGVAAPKLGPEFGLSPQQLGWFFSSSTIGMLLGSLIGGRLADQFGRKIILIACLVLFGLCSLWAGTSHDYAILTVARLSTGLGLGGALPNAMALVAEAGSVEGRASRVGIVTSAMPLGASLCALVGVFASRVEWRILFQIGAWAPLALAGVLYFILPESRAFRTVDITAAEARPGSFEALFGRGRARTTLLLWLSFLLTLAVAYIMINWLPSLMVDKGFTRPQASMAGLVYNLLGALGGMLFGFLLRSGRRRLIVAVAYTGIAASALLLAVSPQAFAIQLIASGLLGFFVNGGQFILYGVSPTFYPTAVRGTGLGGAVSVGRVGAIAGPIVAGAIMGSGGAAPSVLIAILPLTGLALIFAVSLVWSSSEASETALRGS